MRDRSDLVIGFLIGGIAGVIAGLALAPAPGTEMRRQLGRRAADTAGRVRSSSQRLQTQIRGGAGAVGSRARTSAAEVGRRVRERVENALDAVQQTVEEAVESLTAANGTAPGLADAEGEEGVSGGIIPGGGEA